MRKRLNSALVKSVVGLNINYTIAYSTEFAKRKNPLWGATVTFYDRAVDYKPRPTRASDTTKFNREHVWAHIRKSTKSRWYETK